MRQLNAGVLVPIVLSFAIGVLIYLYVTSRSQHKTVLSDYKDLQIALSDLRSERDSLQYDLSTAKDENKRAVGEKEKALAEASEAHMKMVCICWCRRYLSLARARSIDRWVDAFKHVLYCTTTGRNATEN